MARPTVAELLKRVEALEAELMILRAQQATAPVYPASPWDYGRPWQPGPYIWCGSVTTTDPGLIIWNEAA
jgi:hypothetical protein